MEQPGIMVSVGSTRDFKIRFAHDLFLDEFIGTSVSSEGIEVDSGVSEQPFNR